ncbi:MAG TPA: serine hydrolase [Bacteroidales bacterium]
MNTKASAYLMMAVLCLSVCSTRSLMAQKPQSFNTTPDYTAIRIDKSRLARIDSLLQQQIDKGILPHAVTFVAKNGQVIHNKAFGFKDVESRTVLQKDDIFRMYSQTKAIVTVALMTLFEEGKFQLDDPVKNYIPEMTDLVVDKINPDGSYTTRKAASPVTIRQLLSHSSGIGSGKGSDTFREDRQGKEPFSTLKDYVTELVKYPLAYDPGTNFNYHPAADVAGYLVELFSGEPLNVYIKKKLLDPMGIKDMGYYFEGNQAGRLVTIYTEREGKLSPMKMWSGQQDPNIGNKMTYFQGGTGLYGTIEGYARFCQMIANGGTFNGTRILGRRTIEMMSQDQLAHPNSGGKDFCYGLGFQVYPEKRSEGRDISNFTPMVSTGSLTWGGMANTDYLIDPKEGLIILLYTNRTPDTKIWEKFLNTVYQTLE